jgi:hypothetical protein
MALITMIALTTVATFDWWVDPITVKVFSSRQKPYSSSSKTLDLAGQRGECERAQIWSFDTNLQRTNLKLTFSELSASGGGGATLPASVFDYKQQGYVYANSTTHYFCLHDIVDPDHPPHKCRETPKGMCTTGCPADPHGECGGGFDPPGSCNMCTCNVHNTTCNGGVGHRCLPGWYPDPLLDVPAGGIPLVPTNFTQPIYVELCIPYDAPAANYTGSVRLTSQQASEIDVPIKVEVWDISIPRTNESAAFNTAFRFGAHGMMSAWYPKGTPPSAQWSDWFPFLAKHRIPADDIYTHTPPTTSEFVARVASGAKHMAIMDAGMKPPVPPGYVEQTLATLAPVIGNMSALDLADRLYVYGFDEMKQEFNATVYEIYGAIKRRFPTLQTVAVLNWESFPTDLPLDVWVDEYADYGVSPSWDVPTAKEKLRQQWLSSRKGRQYWWYWCIGPSDPSSMNTFIERPAIEARLLYWLTALHAVNGMLYYDVAIWQDQCPKDRPCKAVGRINGTMLTDFNPATWNGNGHSTDGGGANGDGSFTYPGDGGKPLGSIRLSNIADGIEDWELFAKLGATGASHSHAADLITRLVRNRTDFELDPRALEQARREAARRIVAHRGTSAHRRTRGAGA